ncbi:MAG: hypothetical protein ACXWG1_13805 [Usitatibacter sp.]
MNAFFRAALATLAVLSPAAFAATHYTQFSEADDPARWYQPLETSRQKYDNALLEARNALAEALRECRAAPSGRAACEADARRRYRDDVAQARALLAPTRQLG